MSNNHFHALILLLGVLWLLTRMREDFNRILDLPRVAEANNHPNPEKVKAMSRRLASLYGIIMVVIVVATGVAITEILNGVN